MNLDPTVKKFVQTSELVQAPVYVPLQINNEHFIAVQQDLRKIEDIRLLTYYKLMSNGELKSLDNYSNDMLFNLQSLLETSRKDQQVLCNNRHNSRFSRLKPVILFNQNCQTTESMDITPPATVATLEQQIEWEKCRSPFVDACTSSTELDKRNQQNIQTCCSVCCCKNCRELKRRFSARKIKMSTGINTQEEKLSVVTSSGTNCTREDSEKGTQTTTSNLSAREQLKLKRANQEFIDVLLE